MIDSSGKIDNWAVVGPSYASAFRYVRKWALNKKSKSNIQQTREETKENGVATKRLVTCERLIKNVNISVCFVVHHTQCRVIIIISFGFEEMTMGETPPPAPVPPTGLLMKRCKFIWRLLLLSNLALGGPFLSLSASIIMLSFFLSLFTVNNGSLLVNMIVCYISFLSVCLSCVRHIA